MPCPTCGCNADGTWPEILGCTYSGVACSRKCAQRQHLDAQAAQPGVQMTDCGGCGYSTVRWPNET